MAAYRAFLSFLELSSSRDPSATGRLFSRQICGFGTGADEIILNLEQALEAISREHEQVPTTTRVQARYLLSRQITPRTVLIMALVTHEIMVDGIWEKFEPARYSVLLAWEAEEWKIIHLHNSEPWQEQKRGEAYPLQDLEERNRRLGKLVAKRTRQLQQALGTMEVMATTDNLTGVGNRHRFEDVIGKEIARARRYHSPISLVLIDMDKFKQINDSHGHLAGDQVLKQTADVIQAGLREADLLVRWGGDEFLILLPGQALAGAVTAAERICRMINGHDYGLPLGNDSRISMGVAELLPEEDLDDWLSRADQLLYLAKRRRRNCVMWKVPTAKVPASRPDRSS